jgi:hypothetical protein
MARSWNARMVFGCESSQLLDEICLYMDGRLWKHNDIY